MVDISSNFETSDDLSFPSVIIQSLPANKLIQSINALSFFIHKKKKRSSSHWLSRYRMWELKGSATYRGTIFCGIVTDIGKGCRWSFHHGILVNVSQFTSGYVWKSRKYYYFLFKNILK